MRKRPESEHFPNPIKPTHPEPPAATAIYSEDHLKTLVAEDILPESCAVLGIKDKMRSILIDWLVDVHNSFGLQQRTLQLAYRILDNYLVRK